MQRRWKYLMGAATIAAAAALMSPRSAGAQASYGAFTYLEQETEQGTVESLLVPDTASSLGQGARLFFRCGMAQQEVFVSMVGDSLGVGPLVGRYRFAGQESPMLFRWATVQKGVAAFLPDDAISGFADRAASTDTVEITFVTPEDEEETFVFPLDGFAQGVKELSCFSGS